VHSCWCILLIECGLNSNLHLNSNLFELEIEEKKFWKRKTSQNPKPGPSQPSTCQPLPLLYPRPNPRRPSQQCHPGSARSPACPASRGPVRPALPLAQQPAEHAPRPCQPGPSRQHRPPPPATPARDHGRDSRRPLPGRASPRCPGPPLIGPAALRLHHSSHPPSPESPQTLAPPHPLRRAAAPLHRRGRASPLHCILSRAAQEPHLGAGSNSQASAHGPGNCSDRNRTVLQRR